MAIAKVILNGETLMDVTSDTAEAGKMLSGIKATKNDGTKVTGNIASKSSTDLTVSGATVTAPAGYYANDASKAIATTTHPKPTASINSSTGVITASHTQGTGYVTSGTTTSTLTLSTQAAKTVTPTEAVQRAVSAGYYTTGNISVAAISSNYVGTNVARKSAADLSVSGSTITAPAGYYSSAVSKSIEEGSAFPPAMTITQNPVISLNSSTGTITASYTGSRSMVPTVNAGYISQGTSGTISVTGSSSYLLDKYSGGTITPGSKAKTIPSYVWLTSSITIAGDSNLAGGNIAAGVSIFGVNGSYRGDPTARYRAFITSGGSASTQTGLSYDGVFYKTSNTGFDFNFGDTIKLTAGNYGGFGTSIYIDGTMVSYGAERVTTYSYTPNTNFEASYSKDVLYINTYVMPSGTSSITENGTYNVRSYENVDVDIDTGVSYTATLTTNGIDVSNNYVKYNDVIYFSNGDNFIFSPGETLTIICARSDLNQIYVNNKVVANGIHGNSAQYTLALPACNIEIRISSGNANSNSRIYITIPELSITENGTYDVYGYGMADVNVRAADSFTVDQIATRSISGDISGNASIIGSYAFFNCSRLTAASFPSCTSIGSYAFYSCFSLTTISFPSCTSIGSNAFAYCNSLITASFPVCTTIGNSAFTYCYYLTTVSFPVCTKISGNAFSRCYYLTTASFPSCTSIGSYAFAYCSSLTTASFPVCASISGSAFFSCSSLTTVSFPVCTTISSSAFYNCYNLTTVSFPECKTIGSSAFYNCSNLTTVSFPSCSIISNHAFAYCYNLLSVYLLGSSIPSIALLTFSSTPIDGYTTSTGGVYGSIYVPASLYSSYLTATYWSAYSSRFVSV